MKVAATEGSTSPADRVQSAGGQGLSVGIAAAVSVMLLVWCYSTGLCGPFLLDDFHNLSGLSLVQQGMTWANIRDWLLTGASGPTGRPLSLLSFLLNASGWPAESWPFKLTNVLLHGVNSLLVFWLSLLLLRLTQRSSPTLLLLAAATSLLWAFSPYHVSTVLYVIQRMALLAGFFVLFGLVLYIHGRLLLAQGKLVSGVMLIMSAYLFGAGLGVLSKENAAIFVLLVPLVEWLILSQGKTELSPSLRRALIVFMAVPALLFVVALTIQLPSFLEGYEQIRDFSLRERLLSQGRALGYYLWRYLLPGGSYLGIYGGDSFIKSTGLLEPLSTFFWFLAHIILICLSICFRKKQPVFAFGVLFFYVAHLLESSIIPLELLFEHRNYLPSAFLWLGLGSLFPVNRIVQFLFLLVIAHVFLLKSEVTPWEDTTSLSRANADLTISSERTVQNAANIMLAQGNSDGAYRSLHNFMQRHEVTLNTSLMFAISACMSGRFEQDQIDMLVNAVESGSISQLPEQHLKHLTALVVNERCGSFTVADLRLLLQKDMEAHPASPRKRQDYFASVAMLDFIEKDFESFMRHGYQAMEAYPNKSMTLGFCRSLVRIDREEACRCFTRAKPALQGGMYDTLVRSLFKYEDRVLADLEHEREGVCTGELEVKVRSQ